MAARPSGMWRWHELLPIQDPDDIVSLGEGDTPLLDAPRLRSRLGFKSIWIKDESQNPTGSFKALGLSAAVSKAKSYGIKQLVIPTAGNAGGALAAYAARAGMDAYIYMPEDTPLANRLECVAAGAKVKLVPGVISDAARQAHLDADGQAWFDVSTFKEPYRLEGKKVMGLELAEAFGWKLPDAILYPTGGGTGLVGMWKAFDELEKIGWLEGNTRPRMIVVQAQGCAPVVKAFENGLDRCEFWENSWTIAAGLRVPKSFADQEILKIIKESHGTAVAVSDDEIRQAQAELGSMEGIFAAPEGAATYAALIILAGRGHIDANEKVVLFNTGSGLKYLDQEYLRNTSTPL